MVHPSPIKVGSTKSPMGSAFWAGIAHSTPCQCLDFMFANSKLMSKQYFWVWCLQNISKLNIWDKHLLPLAQCLVSTYWVVWGIRQLLDEWVLHQNLEQSQNKRWQKSHQNIAQNYSNQFNDPARFSLINALNLLM